MHLFRTLLLLCQCLVVLPTAAEAADDGLVAHWSFDEGSGNQIHNKTDGPKVRNCI